MALLRRPRALAAIALAGVLLTSGVSPSAASLGTDVEIPAQANDEDLAVEANVELVVSPVTAVFTAKDEAAKFNVLLRNLGERTVAEGSIELSLGARLTGGSALAPQQGTAPDRTVIATSTIGAISGESEESTTITVPLTDIPLFTPAEHGVYPLYAKFLSSDSPSASEVTAYSPIVWEGPHVATSSVNLTQIVPILLPANVHSMPSRPQLDEISTRLDKLLDYATRTQSVLAIDPRIIASIRGYGLEAPQSAQTLLADLESSQLTSFTLQYADADPAAQAALGATELLQPAGLEFLTRFGAWDAQQPDEETELDQPPGDGAATPDENQGSAAADAEGVAATEEPADDAAAEDEVSPDSKEPLHNEIGIAPTLEELGSWPNGVAGSWPAPGDTSAKTLSLLRAAGLDLTVLRSDNVTVTGGPRARLGSSNAIVTDSELDAGVSLALKGQSIAERELGTVQALARLTLASDSGVPGLVLGVDRGHIADSERPEELLELLAQPRWVRAAPLDAQEEGTAQLQAGAPEAERLEQLSAAAENEAFVLEARSLLVNPEYLDSYQRMRLMSLFATGYSAPDAAFHERARLFAKRDLELREGVRLVGTTHAQLVGGSSRIPIQVRNTLPFDAVIRLSVSPTSAALVVPERLFEDIALPEDSSERVLVPAKSRVSSGESGLLLSVSSADGSFTASTSRLAVSISTRVEVVAIAILASAAVLLFGFGILRSVRRRRGSSSGE